MTTEPKFIPKEAAEIRLMDDVTVKVRLIDCVAVSYTHLRMWEDSMIRMLSVSTASLVRAA